MAFSFVLISRRIVVVSGMRLYAELRKRRNRKYPNLAALSNPAVRNSAKRDLRAYGVLADAGQFRIFVHGHRKRFGSHDARRRGTRWYRSSKRSTGAHRRAAASRSSVARCGVRRSRSSAEIRVCSTPAWRANSACDSPCLSRSSLSFTVSHLENLQKCLVSFILGAKN